MTSFRRVNFLIRITEYENYVLFKSIVVDVKQDLDSNTIPIALPHDHLTVD